MIGAMLTTTTVNGAAVWQYDWDTLLDNRYRYACVFSVLE